MATGASLTRLPYPAHPYQSSIDLASTLVQNGLHGIKAQDLAKQIDLVGYYRLKGYWYPFLTPDPNTPSKRTLPFQPNTMWDTIWERYIFDQQLRNIVFDGIVTIEVFLKSYTASELAKAAGPFGYTHPAGLPALSPRDYNDAMGFFTREFEKSSLPHLRHFKKMYSDPLPPVWMLVDCMTYGGFKETLFKGCDQAIRVQLAARLGLCTQQTTHGNEKLLGDWVESIRIARNMTAHHERLWNSKNRKLTPRIPKSRPKNPTWWGNDWEPFRQSKGPAAFLTMEHYLLKQLGVTRWCKDFISLMNQHPNIPINQMGFPDNWQTLPIWQ